LKYYLLKTYPAVRLEGKGAGRINPVRLFAVSLVTPFKGGSPMATYIILGSWTQEGIENIKDGPDRIDGARSMFQAMGAELKEFYLVTGQYDMVIICEVPDAETGAKLALSIGSMGAVRTETLRAFPESKYREFVASLV
jgi:uncharacterized protein with GYD domain